MLAPDDEANALKALRYSLASDIVELVVLTDDELFLKTLREAVGAARRLWHVPTGDKVSDLLIAGGVGILVLDVQALLDAPSVFIGQIKRQFPDLVILVAGPREAEALLAKLISEGTVYRFIHKPMSPARARLFADAAVKRYEGLRRRGVGTVTTLPLRRRGSMRTPLLLGVSALAVALAALLAWRLLLPGTARPPAAAPTAGAAAALSIAPQVDAQARRAAVNAAQQARAEGALAQQLSRALEPRKPTTAGGNPGAGGGSPGVGGGSPGAGGGSPGVAVGSAGAGGGSAGAAGRPGTATASSSNLPVAAAAASSPGAGAAAAAPAASSPGRGVGAAPAAPRRPAELAALAVARADEGHFTDPPGDSAQEYLRAALKAGPRDTATLDAEQAVALKLLAAVRTAIDRRDFDAAARLLEAADGIASPANILSLKSLLASAQRPQDTDRAQQLLMLAHERLQQDQLLEPATDSARYYLTTLRSLDPAHSGLAAATQDFDARLVTRARGELGEKHYEAARALLEQATADGYSSPDAITVLRELAARADGGNAPGAAVAAAASVASAAPAGSGVDASAAPPSGSAEVLSASQLSLVKSVQPVYPRRAEQQSTEGWVDLEFTVDERGRVKDVQVMQGEPPGLFEEAARSAIAQWRYKPVQLAGKAITQRARVRIRFALKH